MATRVRNSGLKENNHSGIVRVFERPCTKDLTNTQHGRLKNRGKTFIATAKTVIGTTATTTKTKNNGKSDKIFEKCCGNQIKLVLQFYSCLRRL